MLISSHQVPSPKVPAPKQKPSQAPRCGELTLHEARRYRDPKDEDEAASGEDRKTVMRRTRPDSWLTRSLRWDAARQVSRRSRRGLMRTAAVEAPVAWQRNDGDGREREPATFGRSKVRLETGQAGCWHPWVAHSVGLCCCS